MSLSSAGSEASTKKTKPIVFIIVIVIVIAVALGAYAWRNNQLQKQQAEAKQKLSQLQAELDAAKAASSKVATPAEPTVKPSSVQPKQATLDNIQAAFSSKNTAALEGYMAPSVKVVYAASEMSKDLTPVDAVKAMDYVNSGAVGPWDFVLSKTVLAKYGSGDYKTYFTATTLVGRASNGFVVAVNFNSDGKINGIFVSASDELL